jgi:two-component system alkaline phosphatase synthesis response regulator PhoP
LEFTSGWRVDVAGGGEEGIALVRSVRPAAVVVDLMMPGVDGYEVSRRLTTDPATAGIPVVLLTARKEIDDRRMRDAGAAGVLFKPFEPEQLGPRIAALCDLSDG